MSESINTYLDHAEDALNAADLLLQHNHVLALANRAYYAIYYCASALLASEGVYTKKHQAARAKFSELFIKTGKMDVQASKIFGNAFAMRQSADYDKSSYLTEAEAHLLLDDARTFLQITRDYFANEGIR
nr:HEPN domain-containing protein [uncultured Arsenicibacter sp.]